KWRMLKRGIRFSRWHASLPVEGEQKDVSNVASDHELVSVVEGRSLYCFEIPVNVRIKADPAFCHRGLSGR
ncbi:MAG: hypothetical protein D6820_16885, partial [Lentisphaerae bacterium]